MGNHLYLQDHKQQIRKETWIKVKRVFHRLKQGLLKKPTIKTKPRFCPSPMKYLTGQTK